MEDRPLFSKLMKYYLSDMGEVPNALLPSEWQIKKSYSNLASLITLWCFLAVDEELKSVIERIEPGVHQFWPVKILMPRGKVYPKQYYGMVIRNFRDSFVPRESEYNRYQSSDDMYFASGDAKRDYADLCFKQQNLKGVHLWREKK